MRESKARLGAWPRLMGNWSFQIRRIWTQRTHVAGLSGTNHRPAAAYHAPNVTAINGAGRQKRLHPSGPDG
jgi:hypothetical protein